MIIFARSYNVCDYFVKKSRFKNRLRLTPNKDLFLYYNNNGFPPQRRVNRIPIGQHRIGNLEQKA